MESMIRTYPNFSYFEKHIVKILEEDMGRSRETSVAMINEYAEVLELLNDGHESAVAFAEMFNDSYSSGTSGQNWVENIFMHLHENVKEIRDFEDFLNSHGVGLVFRYDGLTEIEGRKYVSVYVGESHPTHTVKMAHFFVSPDKKVLKVGDGEGKLLSLKDWRKERETNTK